MTALIRGVIVHKSRMASSWDIWRSSKLSISAIFALVGVGLQFEEKRHCVECFVHTSATITSKQIELSSV
jgi:hypothetical protein